jgi:hypothetical protein
MGMIASAGAGGTEVTEVDGKAALTKALAGIGATAGGTDIKRFTFEDGFTSGAMARLNEQDYALVSERKGELGDGLLGEGWAMMIYPPGQLVVICEAY